MEDWKTVLEELHTTHLHLAQQLRRALSQAKQTTSSLDSSFMETHIDFVFQHDHEKEEVKYKPQRLEVTRTIFTGEQYSLFYNPDNKNGKKREKEKEKEKEEEEEEGGLNIEMEEAEEEQWKWRVEYTIRNQSCSELLVLKVGGEAEKGGVLSYISDFGFYEGGLLNEYRLDPTLLLAVLTGVISPPLLQLLRLKTQAYETAQRLQIQTFWENNNSDQKKGSREEERRDRELKEFVRQLEEKLDLEIQVRRLALQQVQEMMVNSNNKNIKQHDDHYNSAFIPTYNRNNNNTKRQQMASISTFEKITNWRKRSNITIVKLIVGVVCCCWLIWTTFIRGRSPPTRPF
jgi:hypothetical protein